MGFLLLIFLFVVLGVLGVVAVTVWLIAMRSTSQGAFRNVAWPPQVNAFNPPPFPVVPNRYDCRGFPAPPPPPFRRKYYILSVAERSFFEVLRHTLGAEFHIFVKVRLEDVLHLPSGIRHRQAWRNKVSSKHLDFVLCDIKNVSPLLVIELDDASHQRPDCRDRDRDKDAILHAAGLPILRVPVQRAYSTRDLRTMIHGTMAKSASEPATMSPLNHL